MDKNVLEKIYRLEEKIHYDIGVRGIEFLFKEGELLEAVEILNSLSDIIIAAGFYIHSADAPETDGPPGAIALANALKCIGKNVSLLTDRHNYKIIKKIIKENIYNFDVICYEKGFKLNDVLKLSNFKTAKSGLVSIECPGRNINSEYHNMSGHDISRFIDPLDEIFIEAFKTDGIISIGIGDGGNEIGMGNLSELIKNNIQFGNKICSAVKVNCLITAGVSNWGGIALAYALKLYSNNDRVMLVDSKWHERVVSQMVDLGAVDGVTKKSEVSVDGIPIDIHNKIIDEMYGIASER